MINQTAPYDAPARYLPHLIDWAECGAIHYTQAASAQRSQSFLANAQSYEVFAAEYRRIAARARERLVDISELTLADVQADEQPPVPLVDLTAWLRSKLEPWFPGLSSHGWQAIAYVLHVWRPS